MTISRPLLAGNWKMNGLKSARAELDLMLLGCAAVKDHVDILICPPATLVGGFASVTAGSRIAIGGQDCHAEASGAFTGDIAAEMLADAGAVAVIVGHSERRSLHGETDATVRAKALAAGRAGLVAIVCVGETEAQRLSGAALDVVGAQLDGSLPDGATATGLIVAYEPVWAIGTGRTPTTADVDQMHAFIRQRLAARFAGEGEAMRILYGGSVKPANAAELMAVPHVNGALVGGASLKASDFMGIGHAFP